MRFIFVIVCCFCFAFTVKNEKDTLLWNNLTKLTWKDFKGKPDNSSEAVAITASGLSYEMSATIQKGNVHVNCRVGAYFYPYESWCKLNLVDENILAHEQLHFDITELMARKFRQEIEETKFTKNAKKELEAIYRKVNASLDSLQYLYDFSTNYSINKEQQAVWLLKIANELEATRKYE